ncbi:MAG: AAA family ATPase [Pseudomonadota bacterium]
MTYVAFVASEATGRMIEEAIGSLGEVVVSGESDVDKGIKLVDATSPAMVFVEFPMDSEWLRHQQALIQGLSSRKPLLPIVAVGENDSRSLLLTALRSGAADFLVSDGDAEDFRRRVTGLSDRMPRQQLGGADRDGTRMTVVLGGRPDENAALFAEHLGIRIQQGLPEGESCLILDVGFPANDVLTILGIHAEYSLVDAIRNVHSIDRLLIDTAFPRHDSGARLLGVGDDLDGLAELQPADVMVFLDALHYYFSHVVINLAGVTDVDFLHAFSRRADRLLLFGTQTITNFRSNEDLLVSLRGVEEVRGKIELVVDQYETPTLPAARTLAERLDVPLAGTLPTDRPTRLDVINAGVTFMERDPRGGYARGIGGIVGRLTTASGFGAGTSVASRLGKLLGFGGRG